MSYVCIAASVSSRDSSPSWASAPSRASYTSTHYGILPSILSTMFSSRSNFLEHWLYLSPWYLCRFWVVSPLHPSASIFIKGFLYLNQLITDFTDSSIVSLSVNEQFYRFFWGSWLYLFQSFGNCAIFRYSSYPFLTFCTCNLTLVQFLWTSWILCYNQITRTERSVPLDKL